MKCLETRTTAAGFKRRRYQGPRGKRSTTVEIPVSLFNELVRAARAAGYQSDLKPITVRESPSTGNDLATVWRAL